MIYVAKFNCIKLPNGTIHHEREIISSDGETEIIRKDSNLPLRDLTQKELNEVIEEIEYEKTIAGDALPLKGIRSAALKA